jgi:aspartyl-tRNA synthetase
LDIARKVKTINKSFYHLKDSYGTTQLLVDHAEDDCYSVLAKTPVESTVLIEGVVALRPTEARKPVSPVKQLNSKVVPHLTSLFPRETQAK